MNLRRQSTLTEDELQALLDAGPTDRVAFLPKSVSKRQLAETLVALANHNGGTVVLGVSKRGIPQEDVDTSAVRDAIIEATLDADPPLILPSPQPITLIEPRSYTVVVAQVPPGLPHIYSVQGRYLTRAAKQNRPLTTPELRQIILERGEASFENTALPNGSIDDLDSQRVQRYLDQISAPPDEDAVQLLLSRGCVAAVDSASDAGFTDARSVPTFVPTVAGVLLFGREPHRFVRSAEIVCVRYAGKRMGDEFVRQDIYGTLAEQIRQAETFVTSNMRRGMKIAGVTREETTEYPTAVVREAIVNAIAHRSYSVRGEGIRLLMFSDRMEIYSPGRLPGHVTLDNLIDERFSRNEAVVAVLTDMGYIERLGYGIDRMIATMHEAGLPEPLFEETAAGFKVTLYSEGDDLVSPQPAQQPWQHVFLNERQEQAMALVQQQGRITNSEYQALVPDVSPETIRRDLADLVTKDMLLRIGEKRATYYILK